MAEIDLDGPLLDFYARTLQIRSIMAAIEAAARAPGILSTSRVGIDLSLVGAETGNTANAMAFVYLASSYEEFIREEVGQCADFLMIRYPALDEQVRHKVRNLYWQGCITALDKKKSILAAGVGRNKQINGMALSEVQNTIDSVRGFVVLDDSTTLQRAIFYQHSRNFKPEVVDQIGARIGVTGLIDKAADSNRLRAHFGVTTKAEVSKKLVAKMNGFYDRRNQIVHSLTSNTGYALDVIDDYLQMFEAVAESIKNVLQKVVATW